MSNKIQNAGQRETVFFLGAGFSKAVKSDFPTLKELTKEIENNYCAGKNSVTAHFRDEIPTQYKGNIEHLLTFLSSNLPFKTDVQISADDALYKDLKNKIVEYFEQIEYNYQKFNGATRLCQYLHEYKIPCLTLNYDLLLEKLLRDYFSKQKSTKISNYEYFYKCPISPIHLRQKSGSFGFASAEDILLSKDEFPTILKLHGSINWLSAGISQTDPVYCNDSNIKESFAYLTKDLQPMIVPPVMDKTSIYNHTILKSIWRQAYDVLKKAEEIYICGFSFPETDLSIRFLFNSALNENKNSPKIYFINTDNELDKKQKHFTEALIGYKGKLDFTYCCDDSLNKFIDKKLIP